MGVAQACSAAPGPRLEREQLRQLRNQSRSDGLTSAPWRWVGIGPTLVPFNWLCLLLLGLKYCSRRMARQWQVYGLSRVDLILLVAEDGAL